MCAVCLSSTLLPQEAQSHLWDVWCIPDLGGSLPGRTQGPTHMEPHHPLVVQGFFGEELNTHEAPIHLNDSGCLSEVGRIGALWVEPVPLQSCLPLSAGPVAPRSTGSPPARRRCLRSKPKPLSDLPWRGLRNCPYPVHDPAMLLGGTSATPRGFQVHDIRLLHSAKWHTPADGHVSGTIAEGHVSTHPGGRENSRCPANTLTWEEGEADKQTQQHRGRKASLRVHCSLS